MLANLKTAIAVADAGERIIKMKTTKQPCSALKEDGTPCQAAALPESGFCFFHDPSKEAERRVVQTEGGRQGRMRTLGEETPDINFRDCKDVLALLSETINQVRKGLIEPRIANSVGYLANQWVRVSAQSELEEKERIEKHEYGIDPASLNEWERAAIFGQEDGLHAHIALSFARIAEARAEELATNCRPPKS